MKTVHTTFDGSDGSDANNAPAVVIDNVSKKFGDTIAVDELSLTVPRGCIVSLLGPNGAGKTTTIEMCEGFTQPTSGSPISSGFPSTALRRIGDYPAANSSVFRLP